MAGGVGGVGLEVAEDELSSSGLMFRNKVELIIHLGLPEILEEVPGFASIPGVNPHVFHSGYNGKLTGTAENVTLRRSDPGVEYLDLLVDPVQQLVAGFTVRHCGCRAPVQLRRPHQGPDGELVWGVEAVSRRVGHRRIVDIFYSRHEDLYLPQVLLLCCQSRGRGETGEMDDVVKTDAQMAVDRPRDVVVQSLPQSLGAGQLEAANGLKEDVIFPGPLPLLCLPKPIECGRRYDGLDPGDSGQVDVMTILADGAVHLGLSGGQAELLVVMGREVTVSLVPHTAARTHRTLATAMVDAVLL